MDITSQFLPWLDGYLDALEQALRAAKVPYSRKHKGTAQILLDVPSTGYKELLERVQKEPQTCRPGYDEAQQQANEAAADNTSDDGVL